MNKNFMFPSYDSNRNTSIYVPDDKRIVFLDIDGVIAPYYRDTRLLHDIDKTVEYLANKYKDDIYLKMHKFDIAASFYDWSLLAIGRIKNLLDITDAEIVLHSDYRVGNTLDTIKALFKIHGMDEYILDMCRPDLDKIIAIKKYLEENKEKIESYVILDDDDRLNVLDNFILTNNIITNKNIGDAYKILMK